MSESERMAAQVHRKVRYHFTYVSDDEQFPEHFDHWTSYADEVEKNIDFEDDCDGFCLTCAELLIRQGADPEMVFICDVSTRAGRHLVCVYDKWVLDNNYFYVYYWEDAAFQKWHRSMKMSEPGVWRKVEA